MTDRIDMLLRKYARDGSFRAAVDDMTAAVGLLLPEIPLGRDVDEIVDLARMKRAVVPQSVMRRVVEQRSSRPF